MGKGTSKLGGEIFRFFWLDFMFLVSFFLVLGPLLFFEVFWMRHFWIFLPLGLLAWPGSWLFSFHRSGVSITFPLFGVFLASKRSCELLYTVLQLVCYLPYPSPLATQAGIPPNYNANKQRNTNSHSHNTDIDRMT